MSIEKYLNEINNEVAMESAGVDLIAMLLAAVGYAGYRTYQNYKERKKKEATMQHNEKERKEKVAKIKEEILKKYNTDDIKVATEKAVKVIITDVEKMVSKMKRDQKVKELINKSVDEFKKEYPDDDASYELTCVQHEMGKDKNGIYGGYLEIIDADQELKIEMSWILHDIVNALKIKYPDECAVIINFSTGDGDEGCVYINH